MQQFSTCHLSNVAGLAMWKGGHQLATVPSEKAFQPQLMLVTSSAKHIIPLSSRRQRNIPQGRKRGESLGSGPKRQGDPCECQALLSASNLLATQHLLLYPATSPKPQPANPGNSNHPALTQRFTLKLVDQKYPAEPFSVQGESSMLASTRLLALCSHVCTTVGYSQAP